MKTEEEKFNKFMKLLFKQLAKDNFIVYVKEYEAEVIGYSKEFQTVKVRFCSDELFRPERVEVEDDGFGYGTEPSYRYVTKQVPIKEMNINYSEIKLK